MNMYQTIDSMWLDTLEDLFRESPYPVDSRVGPTTEIIGWSGRLIDPAMSWLRNPRRNLSPYYAAAEVLWYMSHDPRVEMIQRYAPQYAKFAEDNGQAYGAYGDRLKGLLQMVVDTLRKTPNTRRCVVSLWRVGDLTYGHGENAVKDVPCTLTWQFLQRDGALHMIVNMRSQDIWLGMPYDIFWNCLILQVIANELDLKVGEYVHNCGSLHLYEKNAEAAYQALDCEYDIPMNDRLWTGSHLAPDMLESLRNASTWEQYARKGTVPPDDVKGTSTVIARTLFELCTRFLNPEFELSELVDPVMKEAAKNYDINSKRKSEVS